MSELYALLQNGEIVNTVTTTMCRRHLQEKYPDYEVKSYYSVPEDVRSRYRYDSERP